MLNLLDLSLKSTYIERDKLYSGYFMDENDKNKDKAVRLWWLYNVLLVAYHNIESIQASSRVELLCLKSRGNDFHFVVSDL